jgi:hypothetical protein
MTWRIGNYDKINCVIFNTIQGVFALSSYLDGLQPVFIYHQTIFKGFSKTQKSLYKQALFRYPQTLFSEGFHIFVRN